MVRGNQDRFVNRLRVRKDQHPHNARPGTTPINLVWTCQNSNINGFNLISLFVGFERKFCLSKYR